MSEEISKNIQYETCGCFKGDYVKGICNHCLSSRFWEGKHTYFFIQKYAPRTVRAVYTEINLS